MVRIRHLVFVILSSLGVSSFVIPNAIAADDWHLADWSARAAVEITKPVGGVDTAAVKVLCQGRAKPDGSDFRVLNAAGRTERVPYVFLGQAEEEGLQALADEGAKVSARDLPGSRAVDLEALLA